MKIVLLANKEQKEELIAGNKEISAELIWSDELASLQNNKGADACIDLLFNNTSERISDLRQLESTIVIINSVLPPLSKSDNDIIRINGWNTFLKRQTIEGAGDESLKEKAEAVFSSLHKKLEWVPDIAGFISPRVVASIINEAYFALQEEVSSKDEIDTAMKLGTNYPYGPFEWSKKIGLHNIYALLKTLSAAEGRYVPAELLTREATV
ncbi:MAG: 3-hydroxyacyl-CoA dehydrogenase family protein [Chitinophagales bacterium]